MFGWLGNLFNPASGLPMIEDTPLDVGGNVFGTDTCSDIGSTGSDGGIGLFDGSISGIDEIGCGMDSSISDIGSIGCGMDGFESGFNDF